MVVYCEAGPSMSGCVCGKDWFGRGVTLERKWVDREELRVGDVEELRLSVI